MGTVGGPWTEEWRKRTDTDTKGISPGMMLYHMCRELGLRKCLFMDLPWITPSVPVPAPGIYKACVSCGGVVKGGCQPACAGKYPVPMFPQELLPYALWRHDFRGWRNEINFLVNYSWEWDMDSNRIIQESYRLPLLQSTHTQNNGCFPD